jgi:hypothetical protein
MRTLLPVLALLLATLPAQARVDNFTLLDQQGQSHELYYLTDKKAVVIMVQGNGCPITRQAWQALREVRAAYAARGIAFLMLNSNLQDDREAIAAEAREFGYDLPILVDEAQLVGEALGVTRTAETFVIDTKTWNLVYRGPIDDRLTYERQQATAKHRYLADALDNVLAGRKVKVAKRDSPGCIVNIPHRDDHLPVASYSQTIAPLLVKHCVECHRPGGIGPWAMTEYKKVKGFAPMIREVLRTKRMAPWHADPHVGAFLGDRSLPPADMAAIVHWVEAGAPRGAGPDPLTAVAAASSEWPLGEPDLIVTLPAFQVPATGVVDYQNPMVGNPLDHAVWVRAAVVLPGDRSVVHHLLAGYSMPAAAGRRVIPQADLFDNYLGGYTPGMEAYEFPQDTGVRLEPGGRFVVQVHYTPTGKATTDVTRIGLYFHKDAPRHILRHTVAVNPAIRIPAGEAAYEDSAYLPFHKEAILYSLFPHAHYRGHSMKFELQHPDGRRQLLLSVPKYDFNWQREYVLKEPVTIPAGSKLIYTTVYDNSAQHRGNPDPTKTVPWGLQSWDEMLYGGVRFRWVDETSERPTHDTQLGRIQQLFGYADRNRDDRISVQELPEQMRPLLERAMGLFDINKDGALSTEELLALRALLGN